MRKIFFALLSIPGFILSILLAKSTEGALWFLISVVSLGIAFILEKLEEINKAQNK